MFRCLKMLMWAACGLAWGTAAATFPTPESGTLPQFYANASGERIYYRTLRSGPDKPDRQYALLLCLHGLGCRGDDNRRQLRMFRDLLLYLRQHPELPVIVVTPQCPEHLKWADMQRRTPGEPLKLVLELCEQLVKDQPIDRRRIYVTGASMGGFGTWSAIQEKPDFFTAAIPISGGGDPKCAAKLTKIAIWAFHGADDHIIPVERTREMIAAIRAAGGNPKYTEYPNGSHFVFGETYQNPEVLDWLFAQRGGAR